MFMKLPTVQNPPDNIVTKDRWGKNQWEVAQELLKEQGTTKFAAFQECPEGEYLPAGSNGAWLETMSWAVMTPNENVRDYFIGWDENKIAPDGSKGYYVLENRPLWSQQTIYDYRDDPHYLRARKELGLLLTKEQEKILKECN